MMLVNNGGLSKLLDNQRRKTENNLQKTLGKLASGQEIRTAADNASGLAISQKLLAIKRGSMQAIRNVQDAGSLVQTVDSAMQEMTEVAQRIRELTVQAMNGTNTQLGFNQAMSTQADTLVIQNEIDELKKNLNDIVQNTEFNSIKLLTNKNPGEFIYENRSASKTIQLSQTSQTQAVNYDHNKVGSNTIAPVRVSNNNNVTEQPTTTSVIKQPDSYTSSTIIEQDPRWSANGDSIIFSSSRDGGQYIVPVNGSDAPVGNNDPVLNQSTKSSNGLFQISNIGSTLYLENRSSTGGYWNRVALFTDYNTNNGSTGYSFSPKTDEAGNTAFVYSDSLGNIKKVDLNVFTKRIQSSDVIPTNDIRNIPASNQTINLPSSPDLYRMNTTTASFRIQKVNDDGKNDLTYWDGAGEPPNEGYYTVSGSAVTFHGTAIIGSEPVDDAQDYYTFDYVGDQFQNNIYSASIPSDAEVYNMHGQDGPRSLKISVGNAVVDKSQMLSERPADVEGTTGIYVDKANGCIEFYGELRPSYSEDVEITYLSDYDGKNEIQSFSINSNIDTYNLTSTNPSANRSLRVYVGGNEIMYDQTKTNGYTYEGGKINLYGDARPDISSNPAVKINYVYDSSSTTKEVYGFGLGSRPEVYNLGSDVSPNSIRVYRNGTEEIAFSGTDGFQYNSSNNQIELFGSGRPNTGDTYSVNMIVPLGDASNQENRVEIPLTYHPETYGLNSPSTFKVKVDGREVSYDATKTNGYVYNGGTNKIEIYGDARPEAKNSSNPDVEVSYVYESPAVMVGDESYDFKLDEKTMDYGIITKEEPRAIRVYQKGNEVPYDAENGFTYDSGLKRLSLHGAFRPTKDNSTGDYQIYSITSDDLQKTVPENSYIYKVELNGAQVKRTNSPSGDGYVYDGQQVEIVGKARPDVKNSTSGINLNVQYFDSLDISLDGSIPGEYFNNYCEHEVGEGLMASEIDPTYFRVSLDGSELSSNQYYFEDNKIILKQDSLTLSTGAHTFSVDYRARQGVGYEANDFTFQVGANAGQNLRLEITSFDNLLRDTNVICVRNYEDAKKGLEIIDHAIDFILGELGTVGAVENGLEHISANLSVMEENTTASMSRIQDADMAKLAMDLVKNQIISQSQQAITSQAKQSRERVLELLK